MLTALIILSVVLGFSVIRRIVDSNDWAEREKQYEKTIGNLNGENKNLLSQSKKIVEEKKSLSLQISQLQEEKENCTQKIITITYADGTSEEFCKKENELIVGNKLEID